MRAFRKPQSAVFPGEDGTINRPEASSQIRISEERSGMRVVSVSADTFVNRKEWETAYSLELIEHILRVKGPAWLCDEIMRDEDPSTSESFIRWNILTYLDREDFAGRRLLDFGSGCGASTMVLSRMFPQTRIVGVEGCRSETDPSSGPLTRKRHHVVGNVDFSPVGP